MNMKYLPTINVWENGITTAIRNGQLRLQKGQWIKCGKGPSSRFVKLTRLQGSIFVVHPNGDAGVSAKRFSTACKLW